jgi:hypothetical protein
VAQCLPGTTKDKLVRRLAYSFVRSCKDADSMQEWVIVREAVLRDMRDPDPDLATAAICSISSLPLNELQSACTNFAHNLMAIMSHGDSTNECVRRSAVHGARYLLLRIGEVKVASETSDAEMKALHSLALALAGCSLDSSALVCSEAMDGLASLCHWAPASSHLIGAKTLGDTLSLPHTTISVLAPPQRHVLCTAVDRAVWVEGTHAASVAGSIAGESEGVPMPKRSTSTCSVWGRGALGILQHLASVTLLWLQQHLALLVARFMSLQDRERRKGMGILVLLLASSLTSASSAASHAPRRPSTPPEAIGGGGGVREGGHVATDGDEQELDAQEGDGLECMELADQILVPMARGTLPALALEACKALLQPVFVLLCYIYSSMRTMHRSKSVLILLVAKPQACKALLQLASLLALRSVAGRCSVYLRSQHKSTYKSTNTG